MRESLIFSRQWDLDIINSYLKQQEKSFSFLTDFDSIDDNKLNFEEYIDLKEEFSSLFIQNEIDMMNNDIKKLLEYFYYGEILLENYINKKYENNNSKRYSYLRVLDCLLRILFEENNSIKNSSKSINEIISDINESYYKKKIVIDDLSDVKYEEKIIDLLGTETIPHFLLREGLRIIRKIKNLNIVDFQIKDNKINDLNEEEDINSTDNIFKEIKNEQKAPFGRIFNETYVLLFFMALKEINNEELFEELENSLDKFIDYFKIDTYKNFDEFKQNYINIDYNKIQKEIINNELSEVNDSYYLCNYILASYKYLIYQIFTKVNYIYINLLLFLEKYTPKEYEQLSYVIRNEINKYKDNNELFISKNKYHITKIYDYNSFKNIFNEEPFLKNRFNEVIKKEEDYEKGSNTLRNKILNFFGNKFNIRNTENKDTIKEHLKLIPLSEGLFEEKTILILISGYYSRKDGHYQEWEQLIKVYKSKYKNPIIYFYNWPSSSFSLTKLIFHR